MYRTGDLLVRAGLVTFPALAEARGNCREGMFERLALQWRATASENESLICQTLATLVAPHPVVVTSESTFDLTLLDHLTKSHARQELFLPVRLEGERLAVLVAQPEQASRVLLPELWKQCEIQPWVVIDTILAEVIEEAYRLRDQGETLWVGAKSRESRTPHLAQPPTEQAAPSDLDALLGEFVAKVAEVPTNHKPARRDAGSKQVLAKIALEKRRARNPPS